jgi:hypothetical protein
MFGSVDVLGTGRASAFTRTDPRSPVNIAPYQPSHVNCSFTKA